MQDARSGHISSGSAPASGGASDYGTGWRQICIVCLGLATHCFNRRSRHAQDASIQSGHCLELAFRRPALARSNFARLRPASRRDGSARRCRRRCSSPERCPEDSPRATKDGPRPVRCVLGCEGPPKSAAFQAQPEKGQILGFDFYRDPLNAKQPMESFRGKHEGRHRRQGRGDGSSTEAS